MAPDWQPTASLSELKLRAKIYKQIRQFFEDRAVLEVETPLICHSTATDPHIASFVTTLLFPQDQLGKKFYLQTSPEFAMKRLVSAGYGSLFQICKAFRNGEVGKLHNPEFSILEWYRIGFNHHELMLEIDALLQTILNCKMADKISYRELFEHFFSINPHTTTVGKLQELAHQKGIRLDGNHPRDTWLDVLLTHIIEPKLGLEKPIFVYDYPANQAALAKIKWVEDYEVGERFELYFGGIELANGYHELADAKEQHQRFQQDNIQRKERGLPQVPIDHFLLEALPSFTECSGVALGLDRLILLAAKGDNLADVLAFPIGRA